MRNKFLNIGILAIIFIFIVNINIFAIGKNNNTGTEDGKQIQTQQQIQTTNQGENIQIQTENKEQIRIKTTDQIETDETEVDNQNQIQDKINPIQIQTNEVNEKGAIKNQNDSISVQRRSQVANAVQQMLQVADRNSGIGQQVKVIAQAQNQNQEKLQIGIEKIQNRNRFVKFLIGPNYSEIKNAQKLLEQNREQIDQLNQIKTQLSNQSDVQILTEQIQILEQVNAQIEETLQNEQKGFSLFGWLVRLFFK